MNLERSEKLMKATMLVLGLFLAATPAMSQQSGTTQAETKTHCDDDGISLNCTATTEAVPPDPLAVFLKNWSTRQRQNAPQAQDQLLADAIKALMAEEQKQRDNKATVDLLYCRQNPKGSITDYDGKPKACADVIE